MLDSMSEQERQRQETAANWASRAEVWDEWADRLAKFAEPLNQPLIEAAAVRPGARVLDLASGAGEPAIPLARLVGPAGEVVATDLVPEMMKGARRRARAEGLRNIRFERADMEALPFAEASFDAVTCRIGLMYAPDPLKALQEALRVLKPGGRAAFLVWGPHADNTHFQVCDAVLEHVMGIEPHEGAFSPTRLGDEGRLLGLFRAAGFADAAERSLRFAPRLDPATKFWRSQAALRLGDRLTRMDEAERSKLDDALAAGFERYREGERIAVSVHARLGSGRKG
jgi:ubiquinone/menaquinone biosynthesis C-methylase UbiE